MKIKIKDPVIKKVVKKFVKRSEVGYKKYGVTLRDDRSNMDEWLNHLQEELMDAVNYIERAREELQVTKPTALELATEAYHQALEDIDIVDPVTFSYTGPEKLSGLTDMNLDWEIVSIVPKKEKYDYGCSFCNCVGKDRCDVA